VGLPELVARGAGVERELVLWSAACSTGAEIWSAAMVVEEYGRRLFRPLAYRGVGTDISRAILAKAEAAVYSEAEIAGVPEELRRAHLLKSRAGREGPDGRPAYRIAPEMRARIAFIQANLIALDKAPRIVADVAFLRNVLIYFGRPTRTASSRASRPVCGQAAFSSRAMPKRFRNCRPVSSRREQHLSKGRLRMPAGGRKIG
jgi:chemotaxis protein methyltransferase CheR